MAKQVTMYESIVQGPMPVGDVGDSEKEVGKALNKWFIKAEQDLTGIFIPDGYAPGANLDLIVYFHGLFKPCGGSASDTVEKYWTNPLFRLRDWVNDSKKNVVLVVPRLDDWGVQSGSKLGMEGDDFLTKVQAAVSERLKKDDFRWTGKTTTRNIYLAAHSGGGTTMLHVAQTVTVGKVLECWGFDSMYRHPKEWVNWAAQGGKYFLFWTDQGANNSEDYGYNVTTIQGILKKATTAAGTKGKKDSDAARAALAVPNVVIEYAPKPKTFSKSTTKHCEVPRTYFPELMKRLP
jgi:hypothetical protein